MRAIMVLAASWLVGLGLAACGAAGVRPGAGITETPGPAEGEADLAAETQMAVERGVFELVFAFPVTANGGYYDLDKGEFTMPTDRNADIRAGIAQGSGTFLVIDATYGATGTAIRRGTPSAAAMEQRSASPCADHVEEFASGGIPIGYEGQVFCWRTGEGNIAQLVVRRFELSGIEKRVLFAYMLWRER